MMTSKKKIFAAFFAGNLVFFFFYSLVLWLLTVFKVSPYGRFVSTFFKGRTKDDAKAFIEANKALFDQMLPEAVSFSNLCVMPLVGFVTGVLAGMIMAPEKKQGGAFWGFLVVLPVSLMFVIKSGINPGAFGALALLWVFTAAGGIIGAGAIKSLKKESGDVQA